MSNFRRQISPFAGFALGLSVVPFATLAQSDDMRNVPRRAERTLPDDSRLESDSAKQKELQAVQRELDAMRGAMSAGQPAPSQIPPTRSTPTGNGASSVPGSPLSGGIRGNEADLAPAIAYPIAADGTAGVAPSNGTVGPQKAATKSIKKQAYGPSVSIPIQRGSPLQVFAVSHRATDDATRDGFTVLPTGAHVKARIVSGVEANAREPYPVLLQLDYSFTGPNKTRVDLSNCFMIAKARANMSTERVMMETESLSCVREDGEHIKREAKGYVAGSDNTFGATGTYISKQGQVLLAAVLASIAKNAGQAIADAQKSTSVLGIDRAASATNVTGNKAAFVAGSALIDGGAMVAQWYLEQAKELLPSIGVGSGQDVFVVMLDTVAVPPLQTEE